MSIENSDIHINIVSFDMPYPPNYGGVIDVYYKILALANSGVKIHLHAFEYGRGHQEELEKYCTEIHIYNRRKLGGVFNLKLPYIVKTRKSSKLLQNLLSNDYPILFEGLHCSYYLLQPALKKRLRIVRMHNIEHLYYMHLAKVEKNPFKRFYFSFEASRLKNYQKNLKKASYIASISPSDHHLLNVKFKNSFYLPVFQPNETICSATGKGDFILYHGNLGVGENNEAALFLVNKIFSKLKYPCILAGSNPSKQLQAIVKKYDHIRLVNPDLDEIYTLIKDAHINVLPTFQDTGIKLKLLNALYLGRFCLVNSKMVKETGLEHLCHLAHDEDAFLDKINDLLQMDFTKEMVSQRKTTLTNMFSNQENIQILIEKIKSY
jgi:hypothetical protein